MFVVYLILKLFYKGRLLLDKGKNLNHLNSKVNLNDEIILDVTTPIYLPIRLHGEYKSLPHEEDTDIIKNITDMTLMLKKISIFFSTR